MRGTFPLRLRRAFRLAALRDEEGPVLSPDRLLLLPRALPSHRGKGIDTAEAQIDVRQAIALHGLPLLATGTAHRRILTAGMLDELRECFLGSERLRLPAVEGTLRH